jgi:cytochrome o ubiquinol oxidase subunit II
LFIYPEQGIASVNRLTVPVGTPISFELTSSTVMNFFVPQLGGQIYTMSGMATHLQLQADQAGTYPGLSAMFSGDGWSMQSKATALRNGFAKLARRVGYSMRSPMPTWRSRAKRSRRSPTAPSLTISSAAL